MDHGRHHSSGHESHGVHLCHKCGWPFPNPHPSAKHRRAHKKICGTIEGFKLVPSAEQITRTNGSDEEPVPYDDHKNPNAAMKFQDGRFGVGRQDSLDNVGKPDTVAEKDLPATISLKHLEDSDIVQPPQNSAESSQNENPFTKAMLFVSNGTLERQDVGLSYSKDSEDRTASASGVVPIEAETLKGVPEESREVGPGASAAECSVQQPTNTNGNEEGKLNENVLDGLILPSEQAAGEVSRTVPTSEKTLGLTLDIFQLNEDFSDRLASKTSMNETGEQEETGGNGNPGTGIERNVIDIVTSNSEGKTSVTESAEKIVEPSVEVHDSVLQDKPDTALTNQLYEDIEMDASYMHVAKDSYGLDGNHEAIVKEVKADPTGFSGSMINDLPEGKPLVVDADIEAGKLNNVVGEDVICIPDDNLGRIDDQTYVKNSSFESMNNSSPSHTNPASNLLEVDNSDDIGEKKTEKHDINVVESGDGIQDLIKANSTSESISTGNQSPDVIEEVNETKGPHLDMVSDREDEELELSMDYKIQGEDAGEDLMSFAVDNNGGENGFERTSIDQSKKELMHSLSYSKPTSQNSGAVDDNHIRESGLDAFGTSTVILQGEADNGPIKPQPDTTVGDVSIGSSSHSDGLEAHWGSISVLSTQSDAFSEAEKTKKSKAVSKQHFDTSDEFEPPSFMTLVEPGGSNEKSTISEIQAVQTAENTRTMPLQAGWFPSVTHGANESLGRKKNEEIIKKVTNWNAKQHTPLKNLLSEPNSETKPMSPNSKQSATPVVGRNYDKVGEDNEDMGGKVSSTAGPETPVAEPTNIEVEKEWSSPARFPAEIKREKRRVKGRPLWFQFVCCSSIN
ncbi:30S ribosomal S5 [Gossypium australe]|uniref:30S ribosomal S5 n=1 Tax=Gossypium australe TaxID=47621 RepID=A0A5B6WGY7_9ROSI|nr:30S ribosomal S5 [Gossypium australe]